MNCIHYIAARFCRLPGLLLLLVDPRRWEITYPLHDLAFYHKEGGFCLSFFLIFFSFFFLSFFSSIFSFFLSFFLSFFCPTVFSILKLKSATRRKRRKQQISCWFARVCFYSWGYSNQPPSSLALSLIHI